MDDPSNYEWSWFLWLVEEGATVVFGPAGDTKV